MNFPYVRLPGALLLLVGAVGFLSGCSVLFTCPDEEAQDERFARVAPANAPVSEVVTIRWDEHSIPFVEARNSDDLAFGVGVVHAHLRLGQMELMRYVSQGRLSEIAGPIPQLETVDTGLRMLDLCGAGEASLARMPPASRAWMTHFTRGINWYVARQPDSTVEHRIFDIEPREFSVRDIMCISRLISADLTWAFYLKFLKLAEQPGWEQALTHALEKRLEDTASFKNPDDPLLARLITSLSKSGSNSLAISGHRSASGHAMLANDPHVGLLLPNFWLMVGIHSPDYHAFGLMIPGVPVIGVGRNPHIAWGGTNMRGISSHLMDVSELDEAQISERHEHLARRWWFDKEITIRDTPYGPILTDLSLFDHDKQPFTVALDWIGRQGSDEIGAFLKASQASNWEEFRSAFQGYQVSAFNILYADDQGNIGMLPAYGQPVLAQPDKTLELVKPVSNPIRAVRSPLDQPRAYNPAEGYIASANNKPFAEPLIPYGFGFSNNDRVGRMQMLASQPKPVSLDDLKHWQRDTYSATADQIRLYLAANTSMVQEDELKALQRALYEWDGRFDSDSRGAVIFETLSFFAWQSYVAQAETTPSMQEYLAGLENWKPDLMTWLQQMRKPELQSVMLEWLKKTSNSLESDWVWGDIQRQPQASPLGIIPLIGDRFSYSDYPGEGGNDTLLKAGRQHGPEQQQVFYGSSARHISDLSSPDANYFVLHGGQDGWLMNPNLADQTKLWRKGEYIKIPLTMDKVHGQFSRFTTLLSPE